MRQAVQFTLNRLVHHLVVCSERNPAGFEVSTSEDGVCIRHSTVVSHYKADGWMSKFSRDLHRGVFDDPAADEWVGTRVVLLSSGTG